MKSIDKIDSNLAITSSLGVDDIVWYPVNEENFTVKGLICSGDKFVRMDETVAKKVSAGVASLNEHTAGGRIFFETDASYVALKVKTKNAKLVNMSTMGTNGFDLYVDEGKGFFHFNIFMPPREFEGGFEGLVELETNRHYKLLYRKMIRKMQLYFPLYGTVSEMYIGLPEGAVLRKYEPYSEPPIVYYGSSITQGGCASRPGNHYPSLVSRKTGRDFLCLGFSGNAHGEEEMAKYIAGLPMSLFVLDYDHNDILNPELLRERHFKFYDIIRNKNRELPIIIMSAPYTLALEDEILKSREIVMESYNKAKERGDNVYFIDGYHMFDGKYRDCATVDDSHPNDYGFVRMAEEVLSVIKEAGL